MFEIIKHGTNCCQASLLLFKYYVSKLGGGRSYSVVTVLTALTHEGVQIMKTADIILEDSLKKQQNCNEIVKYMRYSVPLNSEVTLRESFLIKKLSHKIFT